MAQAKKTAVKKKVSAPKAAAASAELPKMHEMHVNPILAVGLLVVLAGVAVAVWQNQLEELNVAPVVTSTK